MKQLALHALKRAVLGKRSRKEEEAPSVLRRMVDKVAGIVYPTNKSGNNMSVR